MIAAEQVASGMADPYTRARLMPHKLATYVSDGYWKPWPYWNFVGSLVARKIVAGNARLIVNMPPGTFKSTFLSQWLPIWFLENWPHRKVICSTHSQDLATSFGREVRNQFETNPKLRTRIAPDSKAANQWATTGGGGMKCVGVGTASIGFRSHLFLTDDPYGRWSDAYSSAYRSELRVWFDSTARTRLEPGGSIVVLHHRFADDDLTGWLLENSGEHWDHVSLPALAVANDPMGREIGQSLDDSRYSVEALTATRDAMAGMIWSAMYQQAPEKVGAGACYRNFTGENIDPMLSLDRTRPLQVALDYNINPGMHAVIGQHFAERDTLTAVYDVHAPRMTIAECMAACKSIAEKDGPFGEWEIFADPAGTSSSAETGHSHHHAVRRFLVDNKIAYRWRVRDSHCPVIDRVNAFNDALRGSDGRPHYIIHPRCKRLLGDLTNVQADDQGKPDKRRSEFTHATDADGYRVQMVRPVLTYNPETSQHASPFMFIGD